MGENQNKTNKTADYLVDNLSLVISQETQSLSKEELKYTGYIWMSDKVTCKVFKNEDLDNILLPDKIDNPFIVEGFLCNDKWSYSIKFLNGKYHFSKFNLEELKGVKYERHEYVPSFKNGEVKKICFNEYWRPEKDERCNGFETLKPAEFVFVGFKMKTKE